MSPQTPHWWQRAVVYQVYVRSFADSTGDGIGDLDGVRRRLDHLSDLGIDAIWLNPCYPSPQRDHGYDVADYFDIADEYGTLATFDALVADAGERGIRILMDLVPNHCSSDHPWFVEALATSPGSSERARFWIRDGRPDGNDPHGAPPNNWRAAFGGGAWTRISPDDPQWYLATFSPHQPDVDHTNADVQDMFRDVIRFWSDRGVEGFRVDAIAPVGKHPDLPDQPPVPPGTSPVQITWENPYTVFRPEGHDTWRYFRAAIDDYSAEHTGRDLMMVAEAYLDGKPEMLQLFAGDDQFHQVFNFDVMKATWNAPSITGALRDVLGLSAAGITPCWALNNHDTQRIVTRLGRVDAHVSQQMTGNSLAQSDADVDVTVGQRRARALISFLMAMPGSIYLYQGEELGLPEVLDVPPDRRQDPVYEFTGGVHLGRDGCRIPLPWSNRRDGSHGFSDTRADGSPAAEPWLPQPEGWGEYAADGSGGPGDLMLELYRSLIATRREVADPEPQATALIDVAPGLVAARRGRLVVVLNVTDEPIGLDLDDEVFGELRPVLASEPNEMHTPGVVPPDAAVWLAR